MRYWRVKLPPGVRTPFEVYVNGVPQELGRDYQVSSGDLLFTRELVQQKLGPWAWFIGFWGVGTYKRNDEVDVRYELDGRPMVAQALKIIPPPEKGPPEKGPPEKGRPEKGRQESGSPQQDPPEKA